MPSRRDAGAAVGIFSVALGLAHREAFLTLPGIVLVTAGLLLLVFAAREGWSEPGPTFAILFVLLSVASALAPYDPAGINGPEAILTIAAAVVFYALGSRRLAPYRLYVAAALLLAAHVHYLARFPAPGHEDVWHFLNGGVDLLIRGLNPYQGVPIVEGGVHKVLTYAYPPGALIVLAPFRLLSGDIRWAYIVSEGAVILLWGLLLGREGRRARGVDALVLVPLVLPRVSQAFFIFSNHEWVLLAMALGAIVLLLDRRDVAAGLLLGLGIASKQYFLVYPVAFLLPFLDRRAAVTAGLTATAIVLPFLLWAPAPFMHDLVGNLAQAPDPSRLTIWAAFKSAGWELPRLALNALSLFALLVTAVTAWRTRRDPSRALMACGICLALFAACASFAAYNYYVYALVFITWGLLICPAARPGTAPQSPAPAQSPS